MKQLSFYSRFIDDICHGRKTITLRDKDEIDYQPNELVEAISNPEQQVFAQLKIIHVLPVAFDQINQTHAHSENMSLTELKALIREIYPNENNFYEIRFELHKQQDI
ncbi:N(4)-acetylcytidine aminohydrolase [Thalassotalea aquiviva]|uniref:N(4)-acetylcytidine aminohydrolase n=1 Tax=Thalassotalea aquiviva TaxID=3242415 RepID=UPI00352A27FE